MAKKNNTLLYVGAAGALAFMFLNKKGGSLTPVLSATNNNSNNQWPLKDANGVYIRQEPPGYVGDYFNQVLLPQMIKDNPNVGNPGYRLTDAEAQQLLNNYRDVREYCANLSASRHRPLLDVARTYWNESGVAQGRSFLKFTPAVGDPFVGPKENENASSGGWLTSALSFGTSFIPVVGPGLSKVISKMGAIEDVDVVPEVIFNDREAEILITGAAIMTDILPMFFISDDGIALGADERLNTLLRYYTRKHGV